MTYADRTKDNGQRNGVSLSEYKSVVRDGLPVLEVKRMELYHGSQATEIEEFRLGWKYTVAKGVYFTSDFDVAKEYATIGFYNEYRHPTVYIVEIKDLKLLDLRDQVALERVLRQPDFVELVKTKSEVHSSFMKVLETKQGRLAEFLYDDSSGNDSGPLSDLFGDYLKSKGFDGLVVNERLIQFFPSFSINHNEHTVAIHDSWVIFDPKKVTVTNKIWIKAWWDED